MLQAKAISNSSSLSSTHPLHILLALASALVASILSYAVLREMGVLVGRFFLSLSMVAVVLASTLVLGEKLTSKEWIGVAIIMMGVVLIGR
jgi:drug/metabolite transporter (DMT)-like permease